MLNIKKTNQPKKVWKTHLTWLLVKFLWWKESRYNSIFPFLTQHSTLWTLSILCTQAEAYAEAEDLENSLLSTDILPASNRSVFLIKKGQLQN